MTQQIAAALQALRPGARWVVRDSEVEWLDANQTEPTADEIDAWIQRNEYRDLRAPEYPPVSDQLDALWKGGNAAAEMMAKIQAVKVKFPKP